MTRLVCRKDGEDFRELCEVGSDFLIFLDKRNSPLSVRIQKDNEVYDFLVQDLKNHKPWHKNAQYIVCNDGIHYNVDGDYFVDIAEVDYLHLRTHLDFIAYVDDTDQEEYEIINIPEEKKLTEICFGFECVITASDNFIQVYR
uniref:Uncharacterized protein n=1 Tax=Pithovirus LCPAC403 TaxID=2506596 RepID=A0A481ZAY3_9VIRU|nr:MAG: uncharacterized protein LCPAC403_02220 [Pithovirus LCPAC403]